MLRKLIVVYNPRSSHHQAIEREVLVPVRRLQGWLVGRYEVKAAGLDENAHELAKLLNDGDLVIVAGGDGTAAMAANGVMLSEKDVVMGVLGYGNFDDMSRMLKAKRPVEYGEEYVGGVSEIIEKFEAGKTTEIYPLEAKVDGKHWRYAPCYLTLGLFAESTAVFDEKKVRDKLKTGKKGLIFSVWQLIKWYFRHHKQEFLPEGELQQRLVKERKSGDTEVVQAEEKAEVAKEVKEEAETEDRQEVEQREEVKEEAEKRVAKAALLKKEKAEKRAARKQGRQRWLKEAKKNVKKLLKKVRKWWQKIVRKVKSGMVELGGRSKARVSDLKVQTEVKVAKTRQKRQEKRKREIANQPEIIIDTEVTRAEKRKEKTDEDKD